MSQIGYGVFDAFQARQQGGSRAAEIQPDEALAEETAPVGDPDARQFEEVFGIGQAQRTGIDPGQVGCLDVVHGQAGDLLVDEPMDVFLVASQVVDEGQSPGLAVPIGSQACGVAHRVHAGDDAVVGTVELRPQPGVLDDGERATQPRNVEGLARSHQRDGPRGDLSTQRRGGCVGAVIEDEVAVDLVRAQDDVVPQTDLRDPLQFPSFESPADRVVWIAQQQDARSRGDFPLESVRVHDVQAVLSCERDGLDVPA